MRVGSLSEFRARFNENSLIDSCSGEGMQRVTWLRCHLNGYWIVDLEHEFAHARKDGETL